MHTLNSKGQVRTQVQSPKFSSSLLDNSFKETSQFDDLSNKDVKLNTENSRTKFENQKLQKENQIESEFRQNKYSRKNSSKKVELVHDHDSQDEILEHINNLSQNSSDDYPEVCIEQEYAGNRKMMDVRKNPYSKTFAEQIEPAKKPIDKQVFRQETYQNERQTVKPEAKKKRFKSPTAIIPRLVNNQKNSNHKQSDEAYKRMRRRSGKPRIESKSKTKQEDSDTEMLKQEYMRLKQQLIELQKNEQKQTKHKPKRSKNQGMKTHREKEHKKVRINPDFINDDYDDMEYEDEEVDRRGKTPNNATRNLSKNSGNYFDDDSNNEEKLQIKKHPKSIDKNAARKNKNNKNKFAVQQKQTFELTINLQDKKVENLKIVHSSEQKAEQKQKFKASERRCSAGYSSPNYSKYIDKNVHDVEFSNSVIDPTVQNVSYKQKYQAVGFTRNNEQTTQSKSYSNVKKSIHSHHSSTFTVTNQNESSYPVPTHIIDKAKKHRKDMKSGDTFIRNNNYKFMNVNWINQGAQNALPSFYANQQLNSSNINQSNMNLFQQQLKLAMFQNQPDTSLLSGNNQSLLIFDKQTNSIIPVPNNFYSNLTAHNGNQNVSMTPMNASSKINIDESTAFNIANSIKKQMSSGTPKQAQNLTNIPLYFQEGSAIKLANQRNEQLENMKNEQIPFNLEPEILTKQPFSKLKSDANVVKAELKQPEQIDMDSTIKQPTVIDSLNNRIASGIRGIEISKLKQSDFDINNRESEQQINMKALKQSETKLPQVIPEEGQTPIDDDNEQSELLWIALDDQSDTLAKSKKKQQFEDRMKKRNKSNNKSGSKTPEVNKFKAHEAENDVQDFNNENINDFDDNDQEMPKNNKAKIFETKKAKISTPSSGSNLRLKANNYKKKPIMVDLFSSDDNSGMSSINLKVLESSDNPIASISTKSGIQNFKAFQLEGKANKNYEEPLIIPNVDHTSNSSLADMFKTKKSNIINKLSNRDN